jgi:ADP-ribose pyrophosphatase
MWGNCSVKRQASLNTQDPREKQLESTQLYDGRVVKLYVDVVELPNGKTAKREVIRHPGAVAIVPITAEGKIILIRQFRYAAGRAMLEIPAGTLEPGEDPDLCAERELQEEIGQSAKRLEKLGGIFLAPGYSSEYIHLYLAQDLYESRLEADEDEFITASEYTFEQALAFVTSGQIADAKTITSLYLAQARLGR